MFTFRIRSTPNPAARKYIVDEELIAKGSHTFFDISECYEVPLALEIMSLPGVKQIHFFENTMTITKKPEGDWGKIDHSVQTVLAEKLASHDIFFDQLLKNAEEKEKKPLEGDLKVIDEILSRTIRAHLQNDGGDIELLDLEGNILTIKYLGACGDCPSSMTGTLMAIESILQDEFNPNLQVVSL